MYYTLFLIIFFSLLGATSVQAYFPKGSTWYDFYTLKKVSSGGETLSLDTPKDHIQVNEDIILERLTSSFFFPLQSFSFIFVEEALFPCKNLH